MTTVADEVFQTRSPFALRINGFWVPLEGVTPGAGRTAERAASEFVSVDGHRYAQQAPRANREWTLDWSYASEAAVAALAVAAEAPGDVWLHDTAAAAANMLDPRDCYGHTTTAPVVLCSGVPLRALPPGEVLSEGQAFVRGDIAYQFGLWSNKGSGLALASLVFPGGGASINSSGFGAPGATAFTPDEDGWLTVTLSASASTWPGTGLQLVEGTLPTTWLSGERTPCKVTVADPARTLNLVRSGRGLADYGVTLREVG